MVLAFALGSGPQKMYLLQPKEVLTVIGWGLQGQPDTQKDAEIAAQLAREEEEAAAQAAAAHRAQQQQQQVRLWSMH